MKKTLAILLVIMMAMSSMFATEGAVAKEPGTGDIKSLGSSDPATCDVKLTVTNADFAGHYIGFSATDPATADSSAWNSETNLASGVPEIAKTEVKLTVNKNSKIAGNSAEIAGEDADPVYVYWKIRNSAAGNIVLTSTGLLEDGTPNTYLKLTINGTPCSDEKDTQIFTKTMNVGVTKGTQELTMVTDALGADKIGKSYTATMKLQIKAN